MGILMGTKPMRSHAHPKDMPLEDGADFRDRASQVMQPIVLALDAHFATKIEDPAIGDGQTYYLVEAEFFEPAAESVLRLRTLIDAARELSPPKKHRYCGYCGKPLANHVHRLPCKTSQP